MLISYNGLVDLANDGVIVIQDHGAINGASIDLHLGSRILREREQPASVDLATRESVEWVQGFLDNGGRATLAPGEFMLAHTIETFNLPDNISAEFSLKSSLARNGLEHLLAGWIDPGFNSSVLTLELKNSTRYHTLVLREGMPIGQVKFFQHDTVPASKSYRSRGRYNGDNSVSRIKP